MTNRDAGLSRLVGERFATMRRELGWSMDRLAEEAGLHRTSIGLIERGKRSMTLDVADRLAHSLGLRLSDVLRDVGEQGRETDVK